MIRRLFFILVLLLGGFSVPARAQNAGGANAPPLFDDPFLEASYCQYTAAAFKDKAMAKGWAEIERGIALERGSAGDAEKLGELVEMAADLAPFKDSAEDRPAYEQCRDRLAAIHRTAQTAVSPVNTDAPGRVAWYDRTSAATERDPVKRNEALGKIRAWDAYCLMSGHALAAMIADHPAAFGLDLQKPDPAKLLQAAQHEAAQFKAQFEKDFSEAERPQIQAVFDRQRENYRKGYEERRDNEANLTAFAKDQVFACSEGFGQLWASLAR